MNTTKKSGRVMVFGTFDYLHAGHENLFSQAKSLGSEIIAVIAKDKTVKTIKGNYPDHSEKERIQNLEKTGWATQIVLGNSRNKQKVIKDFKPDIIALGYDQFAFTYRLEKYLMDNKIDAEIIRLQPYHPDIYKSSIIKKQKKGENKDVIKADEA